MTITPEIIAAIGVAIVAVLGASVPVIVALQKLNTKVTETHNMVNSRMDEMLELTRTSSEAKGKLLGPDLPPPVDPPPSLT